MDIPKIDPNVRFVGVSKLRQFNAGSLDNLDKTIVIQDDEKPLVVIISYEKYLEIQAEMERLQRLAFTD